MAELLTDQERERFATYLERYAQSNDAMAAQGLVPEALAQKMRAEAMACRVVAKMLRDVETVTLGR